VPFYTGRILRNLKDAEELAACFQERPDTLLLGTEASLRALPPQLRKQLVPVQCWAIDRDTYGVYRLAEAPGSVADASSGPG